MEFLAQQLVLGDPVRGHPAARRDGAPSHSPGSNKIRIDVLSQSEQGLERKVETLWQAANTKGVPGAKRLRVVRWLVALFLADA